MNNIDAIVAEFFHGGVANAKVISQSEFRAALVRAAEGQWEPMETAPKGNGGHGGLVTDPGYIEPPLVLLLFENGIQAVGKWDWYYAEGGNGCIDGCAWINDVCGEVLSQCYGQPIAWRPLPTPPTEQ